MSKVLVTGAAGYIGQHLCQRLRACGKHILALTRDQVTGPWDENLVADIGKDSIPAKSLTGVDTIFHLAGKAHAFFERKGEEKEYEKINVQGTRSLLEAARKAGVSRFIFFSSVKAMGEGGLQCLDETSSCHPQTSYGRTKLVAENFVLHGGYVPHPVVLRLSMVYGPRAKGNLSQMIKFIKKGIFPPLPEIENKRSMVHVEDVVQAAILAAEKPEARSQLYLVTDGNVYSTRQIYLWIRQILGKGEPVFAVPWFVWQFGAKAGDLLGGLRGRRFIFDSQTLDKLFGSAWYSSAKIKKELGFKPRWDLQSAMPEIIYA
ncbi:NAD-dependent epimerase/dehydratase family protein [Desulfohalobiaceae bacterium Ax17]|uniref:NAD-dependent epimerase/dehydratase family protein n=1 Tax=Desulfovulcanus ferrireducens TaxID=2831190 RepID=UPI00207BCD47|nr:NAD-dependent epimerase/dehydratase family protein [Desulfovulcanus ferrireducens]MBT8763043.1 NAD-dependent epimerase/dehydratase family protein [Desulfovulcanus ferrireducens]